jgi:hypothetical protein
MPLLVGPGTVIDPPVDPPVDPPIGGDDGSGGTDPYLPPAGADTPTIAWVDPFNTVWPLTDLTAGWFAAEGLLGLGAAPVAITADEQARGGSRARHIQPRARTITLPLFVEGGSHGEFVTRWRQLARAFTSTRRHGPGRLVVTRPDGTARVCDAYYEAGFDNGAQGGITWDVAALTLYCPSPFWRAQTMVEALHAYHAAGTSFLDPFPTVSLSSTLGRVVINNPGDVESWPTWIVTGPAAVVTVTNHNTGASWILDTGGFRGTQLADGEQVVITTDPGSVTGPAISGDTGWAEALNWPTADLFALDDGDNDIEFEVTGSTTGTSIRCSFYPRYETA